MNKLNVQIQKLEQELTIIKKEVNKTKLIEMFRTDKLIWYRLNGKFTFKEAQEKVKILNMRLPLPSEFMQAVESGNLNKFNNEYFWSSLVHPSYLSNAFIFNGYYGNIEDILQSNKFAVMCVTEIR